jgi:ribonuclease HI
MECHEGLDSDINIYMDGSKSDKEGQWGTGAGFAIRTHDQTIIGKWITLCHTKTVFMAEVIAITQSLKALQAQVQEGIIPQKATITIYIDSQSSIKALASPYINSKTVKECLQIIKTISSNHIIKFAWVKALAGNIGNELADKLAKTGSRQPRPEHGPEPFDTVQLSFVRKIAFQAALDKWQKDWDTKQKARQTKIVCPTINMAKGKQVANLNRKDPGLYI